MAKTKFESGFFDKLASQISRIAGLPATFFAAIAIVVVWAISGPIFDYSEVWQLVINTGTTIITFLLLFVVQNTQNRDTMALQVKLDAIIYVLTGCDNHLIKAEDMTLKQLEALVREYKKHAEEEGLPTDPAKRFAAVNQKVADSVEGKRSAPKKPRAGRTRKKAS